MSLQPPPCLLGNSGKAVVRGISWILATRMFLRTKENVKHPLTSFRTLCRTVTPALSLPTNHYYPCLLDRQVDQFEELEKSSEEAPGATSLKELLESRASR